MNPQITQMSADKDSVIRKFRNTAMDGKVYLTNFYNLDAIAIVNMLKEVVR